MSIHLTAGQRAILAGSLQARQQVLERQLELHQQGLSRIEHAREALEQDGDDAPQRASDREVDLALSDMDLEELEAIRRARQHLQDEAYGLCVSCGNAIPFDRLEIEPQALRCVACESIHEKEL